MSQIQYVRFVDEFKNLIGEEYKVSYEKDNIIFVIKATDDRAEKIKEYHSLIEKIPRDKIPATYSLDVRYPDEEVSGITYKTEIVKDLKDSLNDVASVASLQGFVNVNVKGVGGATLLDAAKNIGKHIFAQVIQKYNYRRADIRFHINYIGGTFQMIITPDDSIAFEKLTRINAVQLIIINKLVSLPLNQFNQIDYLGVHKDDFIFALEDLQNNGVVETLNFNPDAIVDGFGGEPNYPTSFSVKLIQSDFSNYL